MCVPERGAAGPPSGRLDSVTRQFYLSATLYHCTEQAVLNRSVSDPACPKPACRLDSETQVFRTALSVDFLRAV